MAGGEVGMRELVYGAQFTDADRTGYQGVGKKGRSKGLKTGMKCW